MKRWRKSTEQLAQQLEQQGVGGSGLYRSSLNCTITAGGACTIHLVAGNVGYNSLAAGSTNRVVGAIGIALEAAGGMIANRCLSGLGIATGEAHAVGVEVAGNVILGGQSAAQTADSTMGAIVGGREDVVLDGMLAGLAEIMTAGGACAIHLVAGDILDNNLAAGGADRIVSTIAVVDESALSVRACSGNRDGGQANNQDQNEHGGNQSFHYENSFIMY